MTCSTWNIPGEYYDLVVVGGGHAGIEAAFAGARMGARCLLLTMSLETIGQMSCNPAIGGLGKGHLVRELDALGGEMAKAIDATGIQFRMLNRSKGPAVWSPRAQADKHRYSLYMIQALFDQEGLDLRQGTVVDIRVERSRVSSVALDNGTTVRCRAVILCNGTFLNGMIHIGQSRMQSGRAGEPPALGLSEALAREGVEVRRYKTGTPPRVDRRTIDFSRLEEQAGDPSPRPFRFFEDKIRLPQQSCHVAYTTARTHDILRENLDRSPLYSGRIDSVGPRYCPSVEDKVVRFADKERHQLFIEPEGLDSGEMYINGFSTSMPEDVQLEALRAVPGFEHARFTRPGYAIEYDYFPAWQINHRLQFRGIDNLFLAGQINGTSGYEEAAVQGFLAAVNAVHFLDGGDGLQLGRDEAYAGVLIDDLVNRPIDEPYRMFTSRAEFRLLLRQDNADRRLMPLARRLGLLEDWRYEELKQRLELARELSDWLEKTSVDTVAVLRETDRRRREATAEGSCARNPTKASSAFDPVAESDEASSSSDEQIVDTGSSTGSGTGEHSPSPLHARAESDIGIERELGSGSLQHSVHGGKVPAVKLLRRPEIFLADILNHALPGWQERFPEEVCTGVEFDHKYSGYIARQRKAIQNFRRNESQAIPAGIEYMSIQTISTEGRQRLSAVQPSNLGQAARIGGVTPSDLNALWIHLRKVKEAGIS